MCYVGPEVPAQDQGEGHAYCCLRLRYALYLLISYSLLYRDSFPSLLARLNQQVEIRLDCNRRLFNALPYME